MRDRVQELPGLDEVATTREIWSAVANDSAVVSPCFPCHVCRGGPGCSGLIGFITKHDPLRVDKSLDLYENPFAWNHMANMSSPLALAFRFVTPTMRVQSTINNQPKITWLPFEPFMNVSPSTSPTNFILLPNPTGAITFLRFH
eukprot:scaffold4162_cov162-Amphora_coffeaeformis.AAC.14